MWLYAAAVLRNCRSLAAAEGARTCLLEKECSGGLATWPDSYLSALCDGDG